MKFEQGVVFKELIMSSCYFKNYLKEVAVHGILLVQGLKNNWAKFLILWVSAMASTDLVDFPNAISQQLAGLL